MTPEKQTDLIQARVSPRFKRECERAARAARLSLADWTRYALARAAGLLDDAPAPKRKGRA